MRVQMQKFGVLLNSRPAAREAVLRIRQLVPKADKDQVVLLDFEGVEILTPSYADELLDNLRQIYSEVQIENTQTDAVKDTISTVEDLN